MKVKLTCSCIPGEFLCPKAVELWRKVGECYKYAQYEQSDVAWEAYDKQRLVYAKHFKIQESK